MNLKNFLLSFAAAVAGDDDTLALGSRLFVQEAVEAGSMIADGYGVLRIWGGPKPSQLRRISQVSVQMMATAKTQSVAMQLAQSFYEALYLDFDGTTVGQGPPRNNWTIPGLAIAAGTVGPDPDATAGWIVHLVDPAGPPGVVGRDDAAGRGAWNVSFNFDVTFDLLT